MTMVLYAYGYETHFFCQRVYPYSNSVTIGPHDNNNNTDKYQHINAIFQGYFKSAAHSMLSVRALGPSF